MFPFYRVILSHNTESKSKWIVTRMKVRQSNMHCKWNLSHGSTVTKIPLSNIQCMHKAYPMCSVSFKNTAILNTELAFASNMQRNTAEKINSKKVFMYLSKWTSKSLETMFTEEPPATAKEIPLNFQQQDWKVFQWNYSVVIVPFIRRVSYMLPWSFVTW